MDYLLKFSIRNKIYIFLGVLVWIAWGVSGFLNLRLDAVPDITNNQVQILTLAPSQGTLEVEKFITSPLEMAMANIPNLVERRSISRSGLSVLTLVFNEETDIYWARAQIAERIPAVTSQIPFPEVEPEIAPLTTGLGEVYQFYLEGGEGTLEKLKELRKIMDWTIKPRLVSVPGVAEISAWGGLVEQWEVNFDPQILKSHQLTIHDIEQTIKDHHLTAGAGRMESPGQSWQLRVQGQAENLEELGLIPIKNGTLRLRDVATISSGSAPRFGAVTREGKGETVGAIVLMLKDADFRKVVDEVKTRLNSIQSSLPPDVKIKAFIDRTHLVDRATKTIGMNMAEGGIIVILILVLLLGNWRAGLIVASVIPLSMLFAFGWMSSLNIGGNLMSLGAIDFGLIVDGSVIMVEAILFRFSGRILNKINRQQEVEHAAIKIRKSASFGELIILVVYTPLLFLGGVEGKMFIPMAQTIMLAVAGAFILSLTYVPAISALILKPQKPTRLERGLEHIIHKIVNIIGLLVKKPVLIIGSCLLILVISMGVFSTLGGEFIPTLEEGDLAVELVSAQGTSLDQVIENYTKAEKLIRDKFPEVISAVTRTGSAEIPTDPMPVERADLMLILKHKSKWTSAHDRETLCSKMKDVLSEIPGINVEITQPMEMRFNEMLSGIRQDVAVKIMGPDIEKLDEISQQVSALIENISGVSEPIREPVDAFPQFSILPDWERMASLGISTSELHYHSQAIFGGLPAGRFLDGNRIGKIVIRGNPELRENPDKAGELLIGHEKGYVPLSELAAIHPLDIPSQISHENGSRRTFVGFNVVGRDIQSTVADVQAKLNSFLKLPAGYYIEYGGQFENLNSAMKRLWIAVPLALFFIMVMLYMVFHSFSQVLLIITAVPLATAGGIFALWLRGMPFSISAGVGFIALFGVAVLNGIVFISHWNHLKEKFPKLGAWRGVKLTLLERIRPVLLTALVASLGFLPMAISQGDGAEVQRPLATTVIGGLISATLLTLVFLPTWIFRSERKKYSKNIFLLGLLSVSFLTQAQNKPLVLPWNELVAQGISYNGNLKSALNHQNQKKELIYTSSFAGLSELSIMAGQYNSPQLDHSITFQQNFALPGAYRSEKKQNQAAWEEAKAKTLYQQGITAQEIFDMMAEFSYTKNHIYLNSQILSSLQKNLKIAQLRFESGTEKPGPYWQLKLWYDQQIQDSVLLQQNIYYLKRKAEWMLGSTFPDSVIFPKFEKYIDSIPELPKTYIQWAEAYLKSEESKIERQSWNRKPSLKLGAFSQTLIGTFEVGGIPVYYDAGKRFNGAQFAISLPLSPAYLKHHAKAELYLKNAYREEVKWERERVQTDYLNLVQQFRQNLTRERDWSKTLVPEAVRLSEISLSQFSVGEISTLEMNQAFQQFYQIHLEYLKIKYQCMTSWSAIFLKNQ